ncbi:MAG: hypothetical protein AB7T03_04025 [Bacilli bacterium]
MDWYYWVLIGVVVAAVGILKIVAFKKWQEKRTQNGKNVDQENDED